MVKQKEIIDSDPIFVGHGEFQLRDVYATANIEVQSGLVQSINFSTSPGIEPEDVTLITNLLKGKPLLSALEVKAREVDEFDTQREKEVAKVALLEAFHRAVEACFDEE